MTDFYQRIVAAQPTHLGPGSLSSLGETIRRCNSSGYHALGNDYLVIDPRDWPTQFTVPQIVRICHRNYGVGSDGILWGAAAGPRWRSVCAAHLQSGWQRSTEKREMDCASSAVTCLIVDW